MSDLLFSRIMILLHFVIIFPYYFLVLVAVCLNLKYCYFTNYLEYKTLRDERTILCFSAPKSGPAHPGSSLLGNWSTVLEIIEKKITHLA